MHYLQFTYKNKLLTSLERTHRDLKAECIVKRPTSEYILSPPKNIQTFISSFYATLSHAQEDLLQMFILLILKIMIYYYHKYT